MTRNQIEYAKLQETKRHNLRQEKDWSAQRSETERHNLIGESQEAKRIQTAIDQAEETKRHNLETENLSLQQMGISWFQAETARRSQEEAARHNVATETQEQRKTDESIRHNQASEAIETGKLNLGIRGQEETERHNRFTESESQRHNIASEANDRIRAEASALSAQASMVSAEASSSQAATAARRQELSEWTVQFIDIPAAKREYELAEKKKEQMKSEIDLNNARRQDVFSSAALKDQQLETEKQKTALGKAHVWGQWINNAKGMMSGLIDIATVQAALMG